MLVDKLDIFFRELLRVGPHRPDHELGTEHRKKEYAEQHKDERPECDRQAHDETLDEQVERLEMLDKPHRAEETQQTQEPQTARIT